MSKVKPAIPRAVASARRVLEEAKVRDPRDIHVEAIAARHGAVVLYGAIDTSRGHLVRAGDRALIRLPERERGTFGVRFSVGHELAHHVMHPIADHFEQCRGEKKERGVFELEREADCFSTELLTPSDDSARYIDNERPSFDDADRISRVFRVSEEMAAIRVVELTEAPCAVTLVVDGKIKRSTETEAFPARLIRGRPFATSIDRSLRVTVRRVWGGFRCWIVPR